jgi:hypothetical protein
MIEKMSVPVSKAGNEAIMLDGHIRFMQLPVLKVSAEGMNRLRDDQAGGFSR